MAIEESLFQQEGLEPCVLSRVPGFFSDRESLNSHLITFMEGKAVNGWLAMQSQVVIVRWGLLHCPKTGAGLTELDPIRLGELGYLVNAELANPSQSLQVNWNGQGWQLVTLSETGQNPCWRDEVIHLGDGRADQPATMHNLKYHRYWHKDNGMRPFAARLVDFPEVAQ